MHDGLYVFMGEQLNKEQYDERMKDIDLGSYAQYMHWKAKAAEYFKTISPRPVWDTLSHDSTGSYVFHSKNCKECYDVIDCEDSKYLMLIKKGKVRESYDYVDWGEDVELVYECMTVGEKVHNVRFTHELQISNTPNSQ